MEISRRFRVESPLSTFHLPLFPLSFPSSLFTIDAETPDCNSPALQSRIVGMVEGRVRRLKGYQKSHHLPDGHHAAAQAFVRKIGHENVKELIDQFYTDIRSLFGYKRRTFDYTCEDGFGCIKTPDFDLQVRIDQSPEDPKNYQLTTNRRAAQSRDRRRRAFSRLLHAPLRDADRRISRLDQYRRKNRCDRRY